MDLEGDFRVARSECVISENCLRALSAIGRSTATIRGFRFHVDDFIPRTKRESDKQVTDRFDIGEPGTTSAEHGRDLPGFL